MLKAQGISFQYQNTKRIAGFRSISLKVDAGDFIALTGASGAGKSSLLKSLAGQLKPTKGDVAFNGKTIYPELKRLLPEVDGISLVHQDFNLKERYTIVENLDYGIRHLLPGKRKSLIRFYCEICGLSKHLQQKVIDLSGGQRQRAAIAAALVRQPTILLLDEPFNQVDRITQLRMINHIKQLTQQGKLGVVFATHDVDDVFRHEMKVLHLDSGKVAQRGSIKALFDSPKNEQIAGYFGNYFLLTESEVSELGGGNHLHNLGEAYMIRPIHLVAREKGVKVEVEHVIEMGSHGLVTFRLFNKLMEMPVSLQVVQSNPKALRIGLA